LIAFDRALRIVLGPKGEEVAGGCRKLHNEELHNLYASPNIIRVARSRMMGWAGHAASMGEIRNTKVMLQNLKG
jgi:hypothetical protein